MAVLSYDFAAIEKKWQTLWEEQKSFYAKDDFSKPKFYTLIEFPYPSGAGLHVGHPKSNTAMDTIGRKKRMEGYNVLLPIGWDAFGLPTENFAIKNHIHPAIVTKNNIDRFRSQLKALGFAFDWDREIDTTDPNYYKWTQWIFLKLLEHGLAYKTEMPINWCTSCKVGLANEEVVGGVCERCGGEVVRRVKSQWMLRITDYAQKLLDGLDEVDFIDKVKAQQRNWIGRSEGAEVDFALDGLPAKLRVYTTRPDTLFGATYMVVSPEHGLIDEYESRIENIDEVRAYQREAARKSDFERTELNKEKTGVELKGIQAVNPVTGGLIPVWIADYVLTSYGTGAIMAVPAHDERDYEFAKKFGLPIAQVVAGGSIEEEAYTDIASGTMINSGFLDGLSVAEAKKRITEFLTEKGIGEKKVNFKLRDWVFSRQRYWGEPIPVVWCPHCGC
ncbi:MAG: leucine--tRNA ligase, partial [Christensenellaceae bacterium]|nr:leucine--tRNA ligase [Christensenellaceae bacterium]